MSRAGLAAIHLAAQSWASRRLGPDTLQLEGLINSWWGVGGCQCSGLIYSVRGAIDIDPGAPINAIHPVRPHVPNRLASQRCLQICRDRSGRHQPVGRSSHPTEQPTLAPTVMPVGTGSSTAQRPGRDQSSGNAGTWSFRRQIVDEKSHLVRRSFADPLPPCPDTGRRGAGAERGRPGARRGVRRIPNRGPPGSCEPPCSPRACPEPNCLSLEDHSRNERERESSPGLLTAPPRPGSHGGTGCGNGWTDS